MKDHWFDLIDVSAGPVATGEATIAEVGTEIFNLILDVASGVKEPYSDQYGFHNDMTRVPYFMMHFSLGLHQL